MLLNRFCLVLVVFFIYSCSDDATNKTSIENKLQTTSITNKTVSVSYHMVDKVDTVKDESSPLGEWDVSIHYPEISGEINEAVKRKINSYFIETANKYKCADKGEYTFSSEVKYLDDYVLSVRYEAIWFCGISYQSTSSAATFDLVTGNEVMLPTEFISTEARDNLYLNVSNSIKKSMSTEEKAECPAVNSFNYYYKGKESLFFVLQMEHHVDTGCNTEIEIHVTELKQYLKSNSLLLR